MAILSDNKQAVWLCLPVTDMTLGRRVGQLCYKQYFVEGAKA